MIANITRGSNFTGVLRYVMGKPHAELILMGYRFQPFL